MYTSQPKWDADN